MPPAHDDPKVNYRRLHALSEEFTERWRKLQALYLDAAAGFELIRRHVEADQARARSFVSGTELDSEAFQDTRRFSYAEIFAGSFVTSAIHEARQGEVKQRNAPDGDNYVMLGQLCLVSFYDFWNDYLRREYAVAKGYLAPDEANRETIDRILAQHVKHDLWGDIRLLRQGIVHNGGIATGDVTRGKLIEWFAPGERIALTPTHMRELLVALLKYRNELFSEQFPPRYMRIPGSSVQGSG